MTESTPIVAFDQHAASVMAAVLLPGERTPALQPVAPDLPSIGRFLERLAAQGVRCCYEAGPCGFDLQRYLHTKGIACDVIAPALIPRRVGNRVKTDRRDAAQLAVLFRAAFGAAIHRPPSKKKPSAIYCVAAKTSAPTCSARSTVSRSSCSDMGGAARTGGRGRNATSRG